MANIWSGPISNQDYEQLETIAGVTFEQDKKYLIQTDNDAIFRVGTQGRGVKVYAGDRPFEYTQGTEDLYVKCGNSSNGFINISD